jgi:hypothetical protein
MEMQVLAVLVGAEVGQDAAGTPLILNLLRQLPDNAQ